MRDVRQGVVPLASGEQKICPESSASTTSPLRNPGKRGTFPWTTKAVSSSSALFGRHTAPGARSTSGCRTVGLRPTGTQSDVRAPADPTGNPFSRISDGPYTEGGTHTVRRRSGPCQPLGALLLPHFPGGYGDLKLARGRTLTARAPAQR